MFRIDKNKSIFLTQGDTAIMDVRVFNKNWHMLPEPYSWHRIKIQPLLPIIQEVKIKDSEGNIYYEYQFMFDSEGIPIYPVDSDGHPIWYDPTQPLPRDSEGNLIIDPTHIIPKEAEFKKRLPYPKWKQIEELIRPKDRVHLVVMDTKGDVVLEKENDICYIEFLQEDTKDLEPKVYLYQLSYEPDYYEEEDIIHPDDREVNTMVTGLFEIVQKF